MHYITNLFVFVVFVVLINSSHIHKRDKRSPTQSPGKTWSNVDWNKLGKERILKASSSVKAHKAKNVILFLGDGMGISTIAMTRTYKAQTLQTTLKESYLTMETLPYSGLSRTYSVDRTTSDSAATATAYLCGIKGNMGTIGVNEYIQLSDCDNITQDNMATSIGRLFMENGRSVGVVTTARVTHASPAGVYANTPDRDWEETVPPNCHHVDDIAYQLVHRGDNQNIKVILGGGSGRFVPQEIFVHGKRGLRMDKINLMSDWEGKRIKNKQSYAIVYNATSFESVNPSNTDYLFGLFTHNHMSYDSERNKSEEPSLSELTEKAIQILSKDNSGYFLFVEGARIDHAHHDTVAHRAIKDTLAFDEAIEKALSLTNSNETLIVVTADHSHVVTLGGYGVNTESVLGLADNGNLVEDEKPYLQIHYANGPGFSYHRIDNKTVVPRKNLTNANTTGLDFKQDAGIWKKDETHAGEDVAIFASGPMAHLLHSAEEQTFVAHLMMAASCVGQYSDESHCNDVKNENSDVQLKSTLLPILICYLLFALNSRHE